MFSHAPLLILLAACGDDPVESPSPGVDPTVEAQPGEARAGVVEADGGEAALFGGVTAEGRAGDIKLYNDRVQFIIQGAREGHGLIHTGGGVIDADLVRADGALGRDTTEDLFLGFGMSRLFHASEVEIIADGSEGGAAVVCARGADVPWEYFQGMFEFPDPLVPDLGLEIVLTYTLPPDSYTLEIEAQLTNAGDDDAVFTPQDGALMSGEALLPWVPGGGFAGVDSGELPALSFVGRRGEAAVSLWPAEGGYALSPLSELATELGIFLADLPLQELAPGDSTTLRRRVTVAPDVSAGEAARRVAAGETLGQVSGAVSDPDGPVAGARVHFVDASGEVGAFAVTDASGAYSLELPAGDWTAYALAHGEQEVVDRPEGAGRYGAFAAAGVNATQLDALSGASAPPAVPFATGRLPSAPGQVSVQDGGEATLDLSLPAASAVSVSIRDGDGAPLPAVVELRYTEGPPDTEVPEELHEALDIPGGSRVAWAWTASGEVQIPAPPGDYEVWAGHSWRYGQQTAAVSVAEGEDAAASLTLEEVVPRDGWVSVDPHLHAAPSFDGAMPMEDRLIACAATGVELPILTDHDAQADYRDLAEALGLGDRLRAVPGVEVSSLLRGHLNLYPVDPAPLEAINGGAARWWDIPEDTEQYLAWARASGPEGALLQVNHPRSPGMFALAQYDPAAGAASNPDSWSWSFDTFELWNGGVAELEEVRVDWFSFLDMGLRYVPTGASDSHYRYIPCGMGRTDVYLDADPADVTDSELAAAMAAGRVIVASGTTLRATLSAGGDTALPGDTLSASSATLSIQVYAPDWIDPGVLRVYQDGAVLEEIALPGEGKTSQGSAWRDAAPYAATNAFLLDADGGGWTR